MPCHCYQLTYSGENGGKNEEYAQRPSSKNRRYPNLALHRHLQIPNQIDRNTQHGDVGNHIEGSRGKIKRIDVQAFSWPIWFPDLDARTAEEDGNEEEDGVEDAVDDEEANGEPIGNVAVGGAEDAEDEEEDGAFGEEEGEAIDGVGDVGVLAS